MWVGRGRCLPPAVFYGGKVYVAVGDKRHLLRLAATRMQAKDALDPISSRALSSCRVTWPNVELSREPLNGAILARRIAGISKNRDIG